MRATPGTLQKQVSSPKSGEVKDPAVASFGLEETSSVRTAVNRLIMGYSAASAINGEGFGEDYTNRPMATLEDVLGTPDLDFLKDQKNVSTYRTRVVNKLVYGAAAAAGISFKAASINGLPTIGSVVGQAAASVGMSVKQKVRIRVQKTIEFWKKNAGKEGFHSRAVSPGDIFILVPPSVKTILGFSKYADTLKKLDTRDEKRHSVVEYMDEVSTLITTGEK